MIRTADAAILPFDVRATRSNSRAQGADFSRSLNEVSSDSLRASSERVTAPQPPASTGGFVRSSAPGPVPRFTSVPEAAQWPRGPYRQAPPEFGGEWWLVNPFSGPQPWVRAAEIAVGVGQADTAQPPDGFLKLFGLRPERSDASDRGEYILRTAVWEHNLADFQGVGIPAGYTDEQVQAAADAVKHWGMGEPVYYQGRDGWKARFPDSLLPKFEISAETAIKAPQVTAAVYHVQAILRGVEIENRHPLVPSGVFPLERHTVNA